MTCREFAEFLNAYLTGELSPAERAEFDRHLAVCQACVDYLETYRQTIELSRVAMRSDRDVADLEVPEALVAAILAARKKTS